VKAAAILEAPTGLDVPRIKALRAGKAGGWLSPPPPQWRARGPATLGGPAAGGSNAGVNGDTGMVVCRTSAQACLHGGGQTAVVSRGQGKPRPWQAEGLPHLTSRHRAHVL